MARGQVSKKHDASQYGLDFESAAAERHAQLMSALKITCMMKFAPLARLVLNMQERSGGEPLGWPVERYALEFDVHERTVQRWLERLVAAGILSVAYRIKQRGGQGTNLLSINWQMIRRLVCDRGVTARESNNDAGDQGDKKMSPRAGNLPPRGGNLPPSYKEYPSLSPSELNTTTTTALPHAQTQSPRSEEEFCFEKLVKACRLKLPASVLPRRLEDALRTAMARGCSIEQLWNRCAWFHKHWQQWPAEHRAGALHDGLASADPDMAADHGWPYQR
jgi:hypothetical protein